uniref:Uncharacterized protein n=1 Tax=Setaria digitata TaxID=48799 RepID=A0A915PS44_9BILA
MTSRPPTARPKTSAGSRAISARVRRPPSNRANQFNVTERPATRAAIVPEPVSGIPATVSRTGVRLATGTIVLASRSNTIRPITQQGLVGVRAATRVGAGRSVVDKSYYMSLLRMQMNNLMTEIDKLRDVLNKGERDRQNLLIYEKKAEEEANIIRTLQGRLADYNKIMDLMNTNSDLNEIDDELAKLRKERNHAEESLAELANDRQMKEEAIRNLENEIEQQKAENNAIFHSLDPTICDAYEELKKENEKILEEYRMKQQQLNELNRKKEQLDDNLAKSPLKQQASMT